MPRFRVNPFLPPTAEQTDRGKTVVRCVGLVCELGRRSCDRLLVNAMSLIRVARGGILGFIM